ncbi:MAG: galactofuranosylgalactofuranosylrhamnosyl-N-acetylglucosaminyl-diphospho-decaprenol [Mycobacterium sp.]|jgi:galactofuranosylgalactofuranosylrhamnosyl-N-acetylglucosaminyl-diphospho-decaprenol beta-1,5/1,6-galactofuranosyltransferase|uniref:glycosyltransferase n=1 Tax=Mycobacterium sp. TaxID=1785 RepID=UPI0028BC82A8|nr:galactofuranosylgalactofuranosylrhamnosyl-N-acetylglucosaminyl-diphospho-decaprenol [Mycobacterium sp.]
MSDIPSGALDAEESKAVSLLARVILPRPGEPLDVRKLYIEESESNARRAHPPTRTTLEIGAESEVSFATYFNAFPASYWRRWSTLESVVLRVELTGSARVDVYRSKATGARITVGGAPISSETGGHATGSDVGGTASVEFEIGLDPFEDGGWIWFDITTESKVTVHNAGWYAPVPAPGRANVAVGIPTFNRPGDCVNALAALTSDPLVDEVIGAVIVSDQGTKKAVDHPGYANAAAPLGNRLTIHNQPNLGGSGGYSRVMYEALKNTDCEQILFMDDDIRIEPDSVLRALAMNRFAKAPTLVGGQMLNLQEPSHLHVMGEIVDEENFMWTNALNTEYDHNFAKYPLDDEEGPRSKLLHRRIDVDYNGWWMCMIPRQVAEELGQPLPLFIKWDDADYGLRAAEHGYGTVTLPGAAIWHMAWSDKDDAIDWQAYFHLRNRLVVAAMHWDGHVSGLLGSSLRATIKHLLCLEYSTVAIQNKAMADFLAGPEHIFSILESALPDVRKMREQFPDAVVLPGATALPPPTDKRRKTVKIPINPPAIAIRLARGVLHQLKQHDPAHHRHPQLNVATQDARWFLLCKVDGVTVTTADGRGVVYRQRDRAKMFALLRASMRQHIRLARKFNRMRKVYRKALPVLSSKQKWESVLFPGGQERLGHRPHAGQGDDRGTAVESSPANG